jgi:outer membrane protein assembly factor BamA
VTVGASHILDRRDDPAETHRGFYNTLDVAFSTSLMASTEKYGRVVWKNATYHRVSRQVVFARAFSLGLIGGFPGTRPEDIPLSERLYGGGATTHRGFPENQAGPRDAVTGFPIGGSASLFNNLELRFPLIGENIGGVFFHDIGNVYRSVSDISFRWSQPNQPSGSSDPNSAITYGFNYGVQAVGFGIRYKTPVGPVRLDLAWVPNSPTFRGLEGTRDQILAGQGQTTIQRISRFQFHFSIGQTF